MNNNSNHNKSLLRRLLDLEEYLLTPPDTGLAGYCTFLSEEDITRDAAGQLGIKESVKIPKGTKVYLNVDIDRI